MRCLISLPDLLPFAPTNCPWVSEDAVTICMLWLTQAPTPKVIEAPDRTRLNQTKSSCRVTQNSLSPTLNFVKYSAIFCSLIRHGCNVCDFEYLSMWGWVVSSTPLLFPPSHLTTSPFTKVHHTLKVKIIRRSLKLDTQLKQLWNYSLKNFGPERDLWPP